MKPYHLLFALTSAGIFSCAASIPRELVDARQANQRASTGPAAKVAPAELHIANKALAQAEHSFKEDPDSYQTRDLAYIAHRKAQLAEATASIVIEQTNQSRAQSDFQKTQGEIVLSTKEALAESEKSADATQQQLSAEQKARAEAEQRAAAAQAALAKLAAVKEEPRGTVITLSGSVLFASNQAILLPAAQERLNQVADALLATSERNVVVEGYTDSRGSDSFNVELSQRRAEAVRAYLVQRSYEADRIQARGMGEANPVGDNANAEGRANNRRVEIIIERAPGSTSPAKSQF